MQASQESYQGYLHGTLQAILAARINYDRNAAELLQAVNDSFRATAEYLVRGKLVEYAQRVAKQSHRFRDATTAILNDGALALDTEANAVLQALAGIHDMPAVPPLTPGPEHALGQASNPERFGTRFASSYAAGIIKDFGARVVMTRGQLRDVPKVSKRQIIEAKEEILAFVPSHSFWHRALASGTAGVAGPPRPARGRRAPPGRRDLGASRRPLRPTRRPLGPGLTQSAR